MEYYQSDLTMTKEVIEYLKGEKREKEELYATDIGQCKRKIWYSFRNIQKKDLTDNEIFMFSLGDFIHEALIERLNKTKNYAVLKTEYNISKGLPEGVRGRLDAIVLDLVSKEIFPIDFKSSRQFKYGAEFPKIKDVFQIQMYLHALMNMGWTMIKRGKIWYVDRSGSNTPVEIWVEPSEKSMALVDEYLELKLLENIPIPLQKEFGFKNYNKEIILQPNWECKYCGYVEACGQNMSTNKVADICNNNLTISKNYVKHANEIHKFYDNNKRISLE